MYLNNFHILGGGRLKSYLNVSDILQRKHFENIEVIAGKDGLNRLVKWVHIVEVTNIRNLLNGNELILSTGVAWRDNDNLFVSLLNQLIEAQASGLCVEIGTYTSNIPSKVIEIANQFHFPIILFHQEVPFVEITQDIHTLLINQQYEIISNLENYSQLLNKKLLTIKHSNEILKFVHQYLQTYVMIIFTNHRRTVYPKVSTLEEEQMLNDIEKNVRSASSLEVSINLLGSQYANLVLYSRNRLLTEYDQLILDRTATALAQFFIRELYVAEKRRVEETVWIKGWLEGEQNAESVSDFLSFHLPLLKPKGAFVCLYKFVSIERYPNITYFKLQFRSILEQRGFSFFTIEKRNTMIFIVLDERMRDTWKQRMKEGITFLLESESQLGKAAMNPQIIVGKYVQDVVNIHQSYQTAIEALRIKEGLKHSDDYYFYDDLHIYRLISLLNQQSDLYELILEYLEPVISYDKKYNGKLMDTLKMYLQCNGSKQETAKKLFIVRQTLYHRLQKLEVLLGYDFMKHEKRLVIEFMVMSYDFLQVSKQLKAEVNE